MNYEEQDEMQSTINDLGLKVNNLEMWRDDMKAEVVNRLLTQFTEKINLNLEQHLPKVGKVIYDYDKFQKNYAKKLENERDHDEDQLRINDELKNMTMGLNRMKADMLYFTKMFNNDTIAKID